jgi:hypothetical protein
MQSETEIFNRALGLSMAKNCERDHLASATTEKIGGRAPQKDIRAVFVKLINSEKVQSICVSHFVGTLDLLVKVTLTCASCSLSHTDSFINSNEARDSSKDDWN